MVEFNTYPGSPTASCVQVRTVSVAGVASFSFYNNVESIVVNGSPGNDAITNNTACRTTVRGGEGNDVIRTGARQDTIYGEGGHDEIRGPAGTTGSRAELGTTRCTAGPVPTPCSAGPASTFSIVATRPSARTARWTG